MQVWRKSGQHSVGSVEAKRVLPYPYYSVVALHLHCGCILFNFLSHCGCTFSKSLRLVCFCGNFVVFFVDCYNVMCIVVYCTYTATLNVLVSKLIIN